MEEFDRLLPTAPGDGLTEGERLLLRQRLFGLLAERIERYTTGDSSSVPVEVAEELLASVCLTLDVYLRNGGTAKEMLNTELRDILRAGAHLLEAKTEECRELYREACLGLPALTSRSLRDTLTGIGGFFKRYDCRFFSHQIPCDIDYPLCRPVPETLSGVEYVAEYLRRIIMENDFLRRFDPVREDALLTRDSPDYRELIINLYEPVAEAAVGLVLAEEEPFGLAITAAGRERLRQRLELRTPEETSVLLAEAAGKLCGLLGLRDAVSRDYLLQTAAAMAPRLRASLSHGLEGLLP